MNPIVVNSIIVGAGILLAVVLGFILWRAYDRVDDAIDAKQAALLTLSNQFAIYGVTGWFTKLLNHVVTGDEEKIVECIREAIEAPNTPEFFDSNLAKPIWEYYQRKLEADAKKAESAKQVTTSTKE